MLQSLVLSSVSLSSITLTLSTGMTGLQQSSSSPAQCLHGQVCGARREWGQGVEGTRMRVRGVEGMHGESMRELGGIAMALLGVLASTGRGEGKRQQVWQCTRMRMTISQGMKLVKVAGRRGAGWRTWGRFVLDLFELDCTWGDPCRWCLAYQ